MDYIKIKNLIEHDDYKGVKELFTKGVITKDNVNNFQDEKGNTPLHWASSNQTPNRLYIIKLLLKNGADIYIENKNGDIPLHSAAAEWGNSEILQLLAPFTRGFLGFKKYNLNVLNKDGETPLHLASFYGSYNAVSALLEMGAKDDIKNKDGMIPVVKLVSAPYNSDLEQSFYYIFVRLLKDRYFKDIFKIVDNYGRNVLHYATLNGHIKILEPLWHAMNNLGLDFNCQDAEGNTPLHLAAREGDEFIVEKLLEIKQVDKNIRNNDGKTAYDLSTNEYIKKLLSSKLDVTYITYEEFENMEGYDKTCPICFGCLFKEDAECLLENKEEPEDKGPIHDRRRPKVGPVIKLNCGCKNILYHESCILQSNDFYHKCPTCRQEKSYFGKRSLRRLTTSRSQGKLRSRKKHSLRRRRSHSIRSNRRRRSQRSKKHSMRI